MFNVKSPSSKATVEPIANVSPPISKPVKTIGPSGLEALSKTLPVIVVSSSIVTTSSLSIKSLTGSVTIVNVDISRSPAPSSTV